MKNLSERKFNVPNALSVFRILLIPLFVFCYMREYYVWAVAVLIVSGLSDFADGVIARKCNQITNLGKILDPLADKLTQLSVVISVAVKMRNVTLAVILMLFVVKEIMMICGGLVMIRKKIVIHGSRWYGKVATAVFYIVMGIVALFRNLSVTVDIVLVAVAAAFMMFAFSQYIVDYLEIMKKNNSDAE